MSSLLIVWDHKQAPPEGSGETWCWQNYTQQHNVNSILRYVEYHATRLRAKYLGFIHTIGESTVSGKRIVEHLAFEDGLSFWWLTVIAEKSLYRSPIADAIRLLALEEIIVQQKPGRIKLVSANRWLHDAISGLCRGEGIEYEWERLSVEPQPLTRARVYCRLPQFLQALLTLKRLLRVSRPFRDAATSGWYAGDLSVLICGYFANVVPEEAATGHFHSRYWENLQGLMKELGIKGNWLHHNAASSFDTALAWVQDFNRNPQDQGFHSFLGAYFSWRLLFHVLKRWFWLRFKYWHLRSVKKVFLVPGTCLSMWPLMKGHWKTSLLGSVAISNLFSVELFDAAMRDLPRQTKGLYLFEGNSWERAMIHAWRKYGHGQLIAVAHATVRFWDLAYYADPQTVRSSAPFSMPQPDRIALNGKASVEAYHIADYPKESLVECEALRYGYLSNFFAGSAKKKKGNVVNVLIVGDFLLSSTIRLLRLIEATMPHLAGYFTYTIKPHPVCPVLAKDFPLLDLALVTDPLGEILQKFDIVCSSNATTAAVDAYFAGLPVVVILEGDELNISPLRGQAGVFFVSTPKELAEALQTPDLWAVRNPDPNEFFFLDPDLPRWRNLLLSASEC